MYVFISLFRAVCTLVLLVHKKRSVIAPKENTGLYRESAPKFLMVTQCLSLDLQWAWWATAKSGDGEQGSRSSENTHLQQMLPGFYSSPLPYVCWVQVVGIRLLHRGFFSGFPSGFPPSTKSLDKNQLNSSPDSTSTRIEDLHENQLRLMWLPL